MLRRRSSNTEHGQATVELVALLPLIAILVALLWQLVVAGQAVWLVGSAARAAARARAIGGDAPAAARRVLPARLERGLIVRPAATGPEAGVRVEIAIPSVLGPAHLTTVSARARLQPQGR